MNACNPRHRIAFVALTAAFVLGACDSQATPDYHGESLMSIQGSIDLEDSSLEGKLIPAFAFLSNNYAHIVDVDVQGEFPADFQLDVYSPPPADASATDRNLDGAEGVAIGYITAVKEDHPMQVRYASMSGNYMDCGDDPDSKKPCMVERSWGTELFAEIYREQYECLGPSYGDPRDDEECMLVSTKGDEALREPLWTSFAGLSQDYLVAYLREAAPKHSVVAHQLGAAKTGIGKGYHLIALEAKDPDEEPDRQARIDCYAQAVELQTERFNEAHDMNLTATEINNLLCDPKNDPITYGEARARAKCELAADALHQYYQAQADLDCPLYRVKRTPVANPGDKRISVRIGPNVQPTQ